MASASQKSKGIAALLAFLLGTLGVDDFYVGNKLLGFVRLGIFIFAWVVGGFGSIVTFLITFILIFIPLMAVLGLWSLVNIIRYLTMSDERFQQMVAANRGG